MKKSLIFVGLLSIGYTYAQKGNIGINTITPKATLDINPNDENALATAKTNQGIIAPRLSKARIANIEDTNLVEGTLVYATDNTYTGTNSKVEKITEKGYYFYNGTEWVKAGMYDKEDLWKLTKESDRRISWLPTYRSKQKTYSLIPSYLGTDNNYTAQISVEHTTVHPYFPNTEIIASGLKLNSMDKSTNKVINQTSIFGGGMVFTNPDADRSGYLGAITYRKTLEHESEDFGVRLRVDDFSIKTNPDEQTKGKQFQVLTYNNFENNGFDFIINGNQAQISNKNVNIDFNKYITFTPHNFIADDEVNDNIYFNLRKKSGKQSTNQSNLQFTLNRFLKTNGDWSGTTERIQRKIDSRKMGFIDFGIPMNIPNQATSDRNGLAFGFDDSVNMVITGATGKVGIGTTSPTEKLEVNGNIKTSSLAQSGAGDRPVYADENGVLKVGSVTATTSTNGVQNQSTMKCDATNAGKINYTTKEINGEQKGIFGFCMQKGSEYVWAYMVGGANIFGTSSNGAAFGDGL